MVPGYSRARARQLPPVPELSRNRAGPGQAVCRRQALKIIDPMATCVAFVDEADKALSGVSGSGESGVSARPFGTLLTYLSDHNSDVFVVFTPDRRIARAVRGIQVRAV